MTPIEVAWLAGYLEGEGSFLWQKSVSNGKTYRYPLIVVGCTDLDVTEKAAKIMDSGRIYKLVRKEGTKPMWRTQIGGKRALAIMGLILPYMGKRRTERIQELFKLSALRPGTPKGSRAYQAKLTPEAVKEIRTSDRRFDHGFQMDMAKKYGVSWGTIWYARNGLTWKEPELIQ